MLYVNNQDESAIFNARIAKFYVLSMNGSDHPFNRIQQPQCLCSIGVVVTESVFVLQSFLSSAFFILIYYLFLHNPYHLLNCVLAIIIYYL